MLLHGRKIAVVMQQDVAIFDAKSADDDVSRLADRDAKASEGTIIARCAAGEFGVQQRHKRIPAQRSLNTRRVLLISGALKDLQQNEVANQQRLAAGLCLQFGSSRCSMTP